MLWRHHTPRSTLTPTLHLPPPTTRSQMSRAWMSSSVQCRARLDLSPHTRPPRSLCLCLSPTPALDPLATTCLPRRGPSSPEPLSGPGALPRAVGPSPQTSLSSSPLQGRFRPAPCHLPQMVVPPGATTTSGTRLCLPTTSGGPVEQLRLRGGSSSGSNGQAASQDHLPAWTLEWSAARPGSFSVGPQANHPDPIPTESKSDPSRIDGGVSRTLSFLGSGSSQPQPEGAMAGVAGPQIDGMPGEAKPWPAPKERMREET